MTKCALFLATGFEEIEACATIDLLRRAGLEITVVSVNDQLEVEGAHAIVLRADALLTEIDFDGFDALILPGGMPGTNNLYASVPLREAVLAHARAGKLTAAVCAAPLIFGRLGLLQGKEATCYPGFEAELTGATFHPVPVCVAENIITGRSAGYIVEFACAIITTLCGDDAAVKVRDSIIL